MSDWDEDSPQLRQNLRRVLSGIRDEARLRTTPTIKATRVWHTDTLHRLKVPDPDYVGRFRGEAGLEDYNVKVGLYPGVTAQHVADELKQFEKKMQAAVFALDQLIIPDHDLNADQLSAVLDLCAWVHCEWIRIHPFANGNGRTARLWANSLAMRYGLLPFVRLRPRPDGNYGGAAASAMNGRWQPTVNVFRQMLEDAIRQ